jgi:acetyltransferase-like isoleucine patch superfamily enzyme
MIVKIRTFIRWLLLQPYFILLTKIYKMNISKKARVSLGAKLDKTYPKGIYIDDDSYIASGAIIFTHDFSRTLYKNTIIGKRCFIGANAIVMAGVIIGDEVIVGSGAIVTKDIPSHCIVVGNPAKIIKKNIKTTKFGKLIYE